MARRSFSVRQYPPANPSFPTVDSVMNRDTMAEAQDYMGMLAEDRRRYASRVALTDPEGAGIATADIDGMNDGFRSLVSTGRDPAEAAHAIGTVGRVFGSYGNVEDDATFLARFADTRGTDLPSVAREFEAHRKVFGDNYATAYGFNSQVTPSSSHYEDINNGYSDVLSAMRAIEDRYDWQFSRATYRDVMQRTARVAADLAVTGLTLSDVGAEDVVRYALAQNGSLRENVRNPVADLVAAQRSDSASLSLFGDGDYDSAGNRSGDGGNRESNDFGLLRAIRQRVFDHRARAMKAGLGPDDFSDTSLLRRDLADSLRMFSTSSARVSDDTFLRVADSVIDGLRKRSDRVVLSDIARAVADSSSPDQAAALGRWSRSLMLESPEAQRIIDGVTAGFVSRYAGAAGVSLRDPLVTAFSAKVGNALRRKFLDGQAIAGLGGLDAALVPGSELAKSVEDSSLGYISAFGNLAAGKMAQYEAKLKKAQEAKIALEQERQNLGLAD